MSNSDEPIWVLHTCNELSIGGDQSFLMNYYRNIDRSKVQFAFAIQREVDYDHDAEIIKMGGRIHKMHSMNESLVSYAKDLKSILKQHPEYKIVHAHMNHRNVIALAICKFVGVPIRISHSHNLGSKLSLLTRARVELLKYKLQNVATDFLACSKGAAEYLYGRTMNYCIINNAIDSKKFLFSPETRERMRYDLGNGSEFLIGHIGNFSAQKNHKFLIDIFSKLNNNSKLILVGNGPLMEEVKKYAMMIKVLDRVVFLGVRNDISDLMQAFDAFVFPSLFEGLGIVAIEAQAAGLPTYCSDGVPKDVDITNLAVHIPLSASAEEWAAIIEMAEYAQRRDMYRDICMAGYDIHENAKILEDFYIDNLKKIKNNTDRLY
ncbi:glycosyltransferase family 1 protein [Desulfosporosinus sp.]|uniref:glycosyltransferase family 1 protein n=1 Tax=Desulfosporosinus sp. TaxID=157907 RepID=UPI0025C02BF8|nr:glycosyltransferase family 1 protein [Desulfosporosinus sp.]MBC2726057.1 glycosyltransferase family 1 protein [Desulfosporosinus sp.]